MSLFYMPLYIDRFHGGTMLFSTREKSAYLWGLTALWQDPQICLDDFLRILGDAWGGEIPEKSLNRILSKVDIENGIVSSERLESFRLEVEDRQDKNKAKTQKGGEVTAFKMLGYDLKQSRILADLVIKNGLSREEAIALAKPELKPKLKPNLTLGNPTPTPTPTPIELSNDNSHIAQAQENPCEQISQNLPAQPTMTEEQARQLSYSHIPEKEQFVSHGLMHWGHKGLSREEWEEIYAGYEASGWRKNNGQAIHNWKSDMQYSAQRLVESRAKMQSTQKITEARVATASKTKRSALDYDSNAQRDVFERALALHEARMA